MTEFVPDTRFRTLLVVTGCQGLCHVPLPKASANADLLSLFFLIAAGVCAYWKREVTQFNLLRPVCTVEKGLSLIILLLLR